MTQYNALLIPSNHDFANKLKADVKVEGTNILTAVTLAEVKSVFAAESIDIVFMGTAPEHLATRLQIIEYIKTWSFDADKGPSIHFQGTNIGITSAAWVTQILETFVANA